VGSLWEALVGADEAGCGGLVQSPEVAALVLHILHAHATATATATPPPLPSKTPVGGADLTAAPTCPWWMVEASTRPSPGLH
jgi:hypothetical protein